MPIVNLKILGTLTDESFKPVQPGRLPSGLQPVHNAATRPGLANIEESNNE